MDNALEFDRITRAPYNQYPNVTDAIVQSLQSKSDERVKSDDEFKQINRIIERYIERKNDKSISLNESVLRAEEEELKQERRKRKRRSSRLPDLPTKTFSRRTSTTTNSSGFLSTTCSCWGTSRLHGEIQSAGYAAVRGVCGSSPSSTCCQPAPAGSA
ncbi:MAG UNVERIFIED_CONTAM: carboxy terminal-processing peptidase [Planctomycetaceae bacterium]|jgi:hypothetical protein